MAKSENIALQFLKKQSPYNAGEIAGFTERIAQQFIKAGIAKLAPSKAEVEEEKAGDAEHWKQKFYGLVPEHDKTVANLVETIKEREQLKRHLAELEGLMNERVAELEADLRGAKDSLGTKDARVAELEGLLEQATAPQTTAKPETEAAANVQQTAVHEPAADAGNQENAGGQETAAGKKSGRK